jgi:hypothetical protein
MAGECGRLNDATISVTGIAISGGGVLQKRRRIFH